MRWLCRRSSNEPAETVRAASKPSVTNEVFFVTVLRRGLIFLKNSSKSGIRIVRRRKESLPMRSRYFSIRFAVRGVTMTEYGLALGLIAIAAVVGIATLGD